MKKAKLTKTEAQKRKERQKKINTMIDAYIHIFKQNGKVSSHDLEQYGYTYNQIHHYFGGLTELDAEARKTKPKEFFAVEKKKQAQKEKDSVKAGKQEAQAKKAAERQQKIDDICQVYIDIVLAKGYASMQDMIDAGYTKDTIQYYFGSLSKLNVKARSISPESFFDVYLDDVINDKGNQEKLNKALKTKKRFIITTAVTGCKALYSALGSLEQYCEENNAHVLVLSASDPAHNLFAPEAAYGSIDEALILSEHFSLVPFDLALNTNLSVSTVKLSAKHVDPATGMKRIAAQNGTFVFASPKQRLAPIARSNKDLPHFVMTTGAITVPDYSTTSYMSGRSAFIASHDHVMGGLIVEIEDEKWYHFRQFQFDDDGSFIDLGYKYTPSREIIHEPAEAFVLGDWHSGVTDPAAKQAWLEVCEEVGVNKLVMHDMFDGFSINHHDRENVVSRAKKAIAGKHNLKSEIENFTNDINELCEYVDKLVLVKSNHDEVLDRYLASGYYVKDPENHRYALDLAIAMMDGKDPLRHAAEEIGLKYKDNVRWLDRDEDFKVNGIQLGAHGDLGANGSRGSIRSIEGTYSQSVTGHAHSPEILRGAYQVGTSSYLKLNYNRGPSAWVHSSCLVYKNGSRQLINSLYGRWRLLDDDEE